MPDCILIKSADIYCPDHIGKADCLVCFDRIVAVGENLSPSGIPLEFVDGGSFKLMPGFVDGHVHITGGGGEGGPATCTPEADITELVQAGITTVVGCLGTDSESRDLKRLLVKARALEAEGITAYIYTGAYRCPPPTLTGDVALDLVLIDKVIGVGELAISDHRGSHPTYEEILRVVSESRRGGLLAGKAGVVHFHVGRENSGLEILFRIVNETGIPPSQMIPTHVYGRDELFSEALEFGNLGGYIDITAGEEKERPASDAIKIIREKGLINNATLSSDAYGSMPVFEQDGRCTRVGVAMPGGLLDTFRETVLGKKIPVEEALLPLTVNPAGALGLYDRLGGITPGKQADLILMDEELRPFHVMAKGKWVVREGKPTCSTIISRGR